MSAYYNEYDANAAAWLRELIKHGHIADGEVDTRSIVDVRSDDLDGFTQGHFFAGIGGWSLALRLAGWPDDRPVWTGSCPCQPFSAAGKREGFNDERHLWPEYHRLIAECRPPVVLGEQVASKDGLNWLDTVFTDLEGSGYAAGAADLCAAGLGAPHIRQRLWFVGKRLADASGEPGERHTGSFSSQEAGGAGARHPNGRHDLGYSDGGDVGRMADAEHDDGRTDVEGRRPDRRAADGGSGAALWMADAEHQGPPRAGSDAQREGSVVEPRDDCREEGTARPGPVNGHWRAADWLFCRDGKWRPVEPGTFPLAHGLPARVGRLRGYGNAIVPSVAAAFIEAVM